MQKQFQPVLDQLEIDAQRAAAHQQAVAAAALESSLFASIGSLLLGLAALGGLGLALCASATPVTLAEGIRAIERRSESRIRALVEHSSDVVSVLDGDLRIRWQAMSVRDLLGVEPGRWSMLP